ncbi:type 1 glutamine amidotransferase [Elizabethkingia meningoseptica]|uniref:type 1 glutamine amidotransferase n=1 Tax=Elizabethkingia meningoseptica TaxID=238 RepID=UPI001624DD52|nr:GMP synthase [Elizabethkingia meningoseptica]
MNHEVRIALLDMNNNHPNQGMRNIKDISEAFKAHSDYNVSIEVFDVRHKYEMPDIAKFDIFISSGGPGNPHKEGFVWEENYNRFLNSIWKHNKESEAKKYLFLICHSFQLACIYWDLAEVTQRKSYSFGVMPIHKTDEGEKDFLLKNLPEPFYAVDSRAYQVVQPKFDHFEKHRMKILALEKNCPHIDLERAVMSIRFSEEIFGTQFHPEADPEGFLESLKVEKYKNSIIEDYGMEKYQETVDRIDDEDKVVLTRREILPRFLEFAAQQVSKAVSLA